MTHEPIHPEDSRPAAREQSARPVWWLQLTPDDFNALQPLVTFVELAAPEDLPQLRYIVDCLREWFDDRYSSIEGYQQIPFAKWFSLAGDALPLMAFTALLAAPIGYEFLPSSPEDRHAICARLFDLGFRIARHATQGRVGSPVTPVESV